MEHTVKRTGLGHLMVDIETMGEGANAVICSIGAVAFEINTGETGAMFYHKADIQSCLDAGLKVEGQTLIWWLRQSDEARREVSEAGAALPDVLAAFSSFLSDREEDIKLWSNGKHFDMARLADAYKACGMSIPWKYYNVRDVRTLAGIMPEIKERIQRAGTAHHPLDDCQYQIKYCTAIWQYMNNNLVRS